MLSGIEQVAWIDVDDTVKAMHGYHQQGVAYGYSKVKGLNAQLALLSTPLAAPVIAGVRLRKGNVASAHGAPKLDPPGRVRLAVRILGVLHPERAERQQALGRIRRSSEAGVSRPDVRVVLAGTLEDGPVTHAQAQTAAAITTPRHRAGGQVPAPADLRTGFGDENGHLRAAALPPAVAMARAELAPHPGAVAGRNRARAPPQHQVMSVDEVDVGTELHANLRQELAQQPRTRGRRRRHGRCGMRAHRVTSRPVNQPAASNVARASSTLRWE